MPVRSLRGFIESDDEGACSARFLCNLPANRQLRLLAAVIGVYRYENGQSSNILFSTFLTLFLQPLSISPAANTIKRLRVDSNIFSESEICHPTFLGLCGNWKCGSFWRLPVVPPHRSDPLDTE